MTAAGETTALVVVDVQQGFEEPGWGPRNNSDAEERIAALLAAWRAADRPIVHVQHASTEPDSPLRSDRPGFAIKRTVAPEGDEPVVRKSVNSAFIGTELEARLRRDGIDAVVITGLTTDHCVSTTARMAANLGFETVVVADATATFEREAPDGMVLSPEANHQAALAHLQDEFAAVVTSEELIERVG